MRCNGDFSWWLLVFLTYPRSFSVRVSRCFGLPSCLLVTLLLAAFKMQMLWSHCIWATVHNPVAFHLLAKAVIVVSLVCLWALLSFSVSSMIQSVLTVAVYCQSGFTGEKHVLTSPSILLSVLFLSGGLKAREPLKSGYRFQSSACSNATLYSVLLRGGN